MQAIFRPTGDLEIVVTNQINGVLVEVYEGAPDEYREPGHNKELAPGERIFTSADVLVNIEGIPFVLKAGAELSGTPENWAMLQKTQDAKCAQAAVLPPRKQTLLALSRADARSVASAIMGAAAKQD